MILTSLPDLPPRPETAANATFRRRFYERWGHENAVVCGRALQAEYASHVQTLSIKLARGGAGERYLLRRRELLVDDDSFLVLGEGECYGSVLKSPRPVASFAVFFRPGMPAEVLRDRCQRLGDALDLCDKPAPAPGFSPHLRRHDTRVTPRLLHLWHAIEAGERDEQWLEERLLDLLATLLDVEADDHHHLVPDATPRRAARLELARRLRLAADFMHSHATEPLTLERMAAVACLSRYHFVRAFGRQFGCTPHAFLTARRAALARRLIADGQTDSEGIAQASGFGSRWALRRALARHPG